jgi:hypothetical protein
LVLAQDNISFLSPLMGRMRWKGNRLAGCDYCEGKHPIVWAVDPQGIRDAVSLDIPGAGYIGVRDVAAGPDGSLTAVGLAISGDSQMGLFIVWMSPERVRQVITQVSPYDPEVVAVAPDGTIWTVGAMLNDNHVVVHPNVLRHYTPSGQLLTSTMFSGHLNNAGGMYNDSATSALMVSNDRVGWLTATCQYVEFSFEGARLGTHTCPNGYTNIRDIRGVGLSSKNDVLIGIQGQAPLAPVQLDRVTDTWKLVPMLKESGKPTTILGFDGLTLVTAAAVAGGPWTMGRYTLE